MKTLQVFNFGRVVGDYRAIRIRKDSEWDEYRVEFITSNGIVDEDETYFTDDKQDAIDTAQHQFNMMLETEIVE